MTGRRSEKPLKSILSKRPREAARAAKRPREAAGRHQKARKAPAQGGAAQTASQSLAAAKGGAPVSPWGVTVGERILWKNDQNRMTHAGFECSCLGPRCYSSAGCPCPSLIEGSSNT
jgi:hypothetical protein